MTTKEKTLKEFDENWDGNKNKIGWYAILVTGYPHDGGARKLIRNFISQALDSQREEIIEIIETEKLLILDNDNAPKANTIDTLNFYLEVYNKEIINSIKEI